MYVANEVYVVCSSSPTQPLLVSVIFTPIPATFEVQLLPAHNQTSALAELNATDTLAAVVPLFSTSWWSSILVKVSPLAVYFFVDGSDTATNFSIPSSETPVTGDANNPVFENASPVPTTVQKTFTHGLNNLSAVLKPLLGGYNGSGGPISVTEVAGTRTADTITLAAHLVPAAATAEFPFKVEYPHSLAP